MRQHRIVSLILPLTLLLAVGCSDDEPTAPPVPDPTVENLDLEICLATFAGGDLEAFGATLHPDFRFVRTDDLGEVVTSYDRAAQLAVAEAMTGGVAGSEGAVLDSLSLVALFPQGNWEPTERNDPVGPHRASALKCTFQFGLRAHRSDMDLTWVIDGLLDAVIDTLDGESRLLGLVDRTFDGRPVERVSWSWLQNVWLAPEAPSLPSGPDWLSLQLVGAHDNRDWNRLTELIHPDFRDVLPDGSVLDRTDQLAVLADFMAGRPDTSGTSVANLDIIRWDGLTRGWETVHESDPHFGDLDGAVARWLNVHIVYQTTDGAAWEVDGLVRMVAVGSDRGWRLIGFQDVTHETGDGTLAWWYLKRRFEPTRSLGGSWPEDRQSLLLR